MTFILFNFGRKPLIMRKCCAIFIAAKSIPIMALWSSGMIPPSGKTLVKCSKHGEAPISIIGKARLFFC